MFRGEESVRLTSALAKEDLEEAVADALERLGGVRLSSRGQFCVEGDRFSSGLSRVEIEGDVSKGASRTPGS